jgi:hypothetical protein
VDNIERIKEYLSEERFKIKLNDHVAELTKSLTSSISEQNSSLQRPVDRDQFLKRLQYYEEAARDLLAAELLIGRWGSNEQIKTAIMPLNRLASEIKPTGGIDILLQSRWYPALLLLYAGCLGGIAGDNYEVLFRLMHTRVPNPYGHTNRDVLLIASTAASLEFYETFRWFPGLDKRRYPKSDHIFELFQPYANTFLNLGGADYEQIFDRAEMLMTVEYMHLENPKFVGVSQLWGPIGRFGWKNNFVSPLDPLVKEAILAGKSWLPARAGLFQGSTDRFVELAQSLSLFIASHPW